METMKIFNKAKFGYTEQYEVTYTYIDKDGFSKRGRTYYYAMNKNAHKQISCVFKQQHPSYKLLCVGYM